MKAANIVAAKTVAWKSSRANRFILVSLLLCLDYSTKWTEGQAKTLCPVGLYAPALTM